MRMRPNCMLIFVVLFLSGVTASTSFKQNLKQHEDALDLAFHADLLKQLADVRSSTSTSSTGIAPSQQTSTASTSTLHLLSFATFADNSTNTLQIYTNDSLPKSPAPSSECAAALTATVSCNSTISLMSISPYMFMNDLSTVCTAGCTSGLESYRAGVVTACSGYTIADSGNISYAPTLAVDYVRGAYMTQCLQDPSTGQYCGPTIQSFNATGGLLSLPTANLCSFCTLETLNVTLSNPTTYSSPIAGLLSSAVGMCGPQFDQYNISSPPPSQVVFDPGTGPFGANSSTGPTVDCALTGRNITTNGTTTCVAIAAQYSVSEYDVFSSNPSLSVDCNIAADTALCVPQTCTTYTIAINDTCDSVAQMAGGVTGVNITTAQLQSFNLDLGTYCQLMALRVGKSICLSPNGGWPNVGATSAGNPSATPTQLAPIPTPTVSGTTPNCGRYYQVQIGDICQTVAIANGVSLADFITLNPQIDANCTNLWLDYYYCVAPYPPFSTVTASPTITTNYSTATTFSYTIPTNYTITVVTSTLTAAGVPAPTNVAPGTRTVACGNYYDIQNGDTLDSVATLVGVNSTLLTTWNELSNGVLPAVGSSICIIFPRGNYTLVPAPRPTNVFANASTACAQYYTVRSGDGCTSIESQFALTSAQFDGLNPGLLPDCTNLILGVAYCVFPISPFSTPPSNSSAPPSNVAPGTITNGSCTDYYTVVSGDNCGAIESKFNITSAAFSAWNPEIVADCSNLQLGLAYCVAGPMISGGSGGPPPNLANGTLANCTTYHTVVSGDNCPAIETTYSIAAADFFRWNPEVSTNCVNILVGEAYCVGGGTSPCAKIYTVKSGDSCFAVTQAQNITQAQLITLNPFLDANCDLSVGENLCVG